jgi:putative signal transducing protein
MNRDKKTNSQENPDLRLKEAATVQGPVEAEIIRSLLESSGIPCLMRGLVVQSVHAFSADGLGKIRIMVPEEKLEIAREILKQYAPED